MPEPAESVDSTSLIHARGLTKRFGATVAVDDLTAGVAAGFPDGLRGRGCESPAQQIEGLPDALHLSGQRLAFDVHRILQEDQRQDDGNHL